MAAKKEKELISFQGFKFTPKDIETIADLVREYCAGYNGPVDLRRLSPIVRYYATTRGLIVSGDEYLNHRGEREKGIKANRLYFKAHKTFYSTSYDMPPESIWIIMKPMFGDGYSIGYSIVYKKEWSELNIPPLRRTMKDDDAIMIRGEMMDILNKMSCCGYIYSQFAGDIWAIEIRPEHREKKAVTK